MKQPKPERMENKMRILIYTGKGGVGKTSITAATGVKIARSGKKVLMMSTDQAHSLGDSLNMRIGGQPVHVADNLDALEIDPIEESEKAWGNLRDYIKEIISEKANGTLEADEALMFPGLNELFSLLRILDAYDSNRYDVIMVDCAPTGETLSLLRYPERLSVIDDKLLPSVRSMNNTFGGLIQRRTSVPKPRDQVFTEFDGLVKRLDRLQQILRDRDVTSMRIVMTPERIVLDEARRNYTWINEFDFGADAVYVNKIYPEEAMKGYFEGWARMQEEGLKLADESFGSCKVFRLGLQSSELSGIDMLSSAAEQMYSDTDPSQVFSKEPAFTMEEEHGTRIMVIRLPYAQKDEIRLEKKGEDLVLAVRNETRRFKLPDKVSRRRLTGWDFEGGRLRVRFDYD